MRNTENKVDPVQETWQCRNVTFIFLDKNTFLDTQKYILEQKLKKCRLPKQNIASSYRIYKVMYAWTLLNMILNTEQKQRERKAERVTGLQAFGTGGKWNHMHFKSIPNKYSHFPFCYSVDTVSRQTERLTAFTESTLKRCD